MALKYLSSPFLLSSPLNPNEYGLPIAFRWKSNGSFPAVTQSVGAVPTAFELQIRWPTRGY